MSYNPTQEIGKGKSMQEIFSTYITEAYLGVYLRIIFSIKCERVETDITGLRLQVGAWLELIESGYCLALLSQYYKQQSPRWERIAVGVASSVAM